MRVRDKLANSLQSYERDQTAVTVGTYKMPTHGILIRGDHPCARPRSNHAQVFAAPVPEFTLPYQIQHTTRPIPVIHTFGWDLLWTFSTTPSGFNLLIILTDTLTNFIWAKPLVRMMTKQQQVSLKLHLCLICSLGDINNGQWLAVHDTQLYLVRQWLQHQEIIRVTYASIEQWASRVCQRHITLGDQAQSGALPPRFG